ncbi:MAG: DUF896 domain-containing protein [Candidatus Sericytochromatia bacterium]|nr:DUF896 domain-containing protein [Candidatus Sericytochromatia bacterium]
MISPEKIARINELARKSRLPEGLTAAERDEQASLRQAYIEAVRASLQPQLESIRLVDDHGQIINPRTGTAEGFVRDEPQGAP